MCPILRRKINLIHLILGINIYTLLLCDGYSCDMTLFCRKMQFLKSEYELTLQLL